MLDTRILIESAVKDFTDILTSSLNDVSKRQKDAEELLKQSHSTVSAKFVLEPVRLDLISRL